MKCAGCNSDLVPVSLYMRRYNDFPQYQGALLLFVSGGYGMFFDDKSERFVLCSACALSLVKSQPFLANWFAPYLGNEGTNPIGEVDG